MAGYVGSIGNRSGLTLGISQTTTAIPEMTVAIF